MKLEGSYTFEAPREVVWDVLLDPVLLAQVLPGSEGLEPLGDDKYKATLKIQVGPVQGVFEGTVALADINKPDSYRMDINGKGAPGFVKGGGAVRLETQGTTTIMHYTGEAQVGGRIASVGQRLLESSGKALVNQSLEAINQRLADAGVKLHLSEVKGPVMDRLQRSDLLPSLTGGIFLSQFDAFSELAGEGAPRPAGPLPNDPFQS